MLNNTHRGAANIEQPNKTLNLNDLSWDDIRIFLACSKEKSFRKAADNLGISSSTVVRRIGQLEGNLNVRLFDRLPEGITITEEALTIKSSAEQMESSLLNLLHSQSYRDTSLKGQVSISITEGLGTYWLIPRLVSFQKQFPNLTLNVQCSTKNVDVLRLESDFAIQFQRPTNPDVIITKLGQLHTYPFASKDYIARKGTPTKKEDLKNHKFILQISNLDEEKYLANFLGVENIDDIVALKTNSSTTLFYAIERGAGIGVIPTYATALNAPVVPLDCDLQNKLDIWLTYHPSVKKTPRKAMIIEWIKSIFNPRVYPWFSEQFIHPEELKNMIPTEAEININDNYFSVSPYDR